MKKIYTLRDARKNEEAKQNFDFAVDIRAVELKQAEKALLAKYPGIGVLCRGGKPVYYVYPVGGSYVESSDLVVLSQLVNVLE